ncbi:MAG: hypothetical protein KDA89_02320 [Planctomycetaceae bacterium]|nr:hypothetical protein [Planctomycetaceae bacterium]
MHRTVLALVLFGGLSCLPCVAQPIAAARTDQPDPFAQGDSGFPFAELEMQRPLDSLRDVGFSTQVFAAVLTDHHGKPLSHVTAALVPDSDASFVGHGTYLENFDLTDSAGRFRVEGPVVRSESVDHRRIVFHRPDHGLFVMPASVAADAGAIVWPEPAQLDWAVPESVARPGDTIEVRRTDSLIRRYAPELSLQGRADGRISARLLPGRYVITTDAHLSVPVSNGGFVRQAAWFSAESGQQVVPAMLTGRGTIRGRLADAEGRWVALLLPRPGSGENERQFTGDGNLIVWDSAVLNERGAFEFRNLPEGQYEVRVAHFAEHSVSRQPVRIRRTELTADQAVVSLDGDLSAETLRFRLLQLLDSPPEGVSLPPILFAEGQTREQVLSELKAMLQSDELSAEIRGTIVRNMSPQLTDSSELLAEAQISYWPGLQDINDRMHVRNQLMQVISSVAAQTDRLQPLLHHSLPDVRNGAVVLLVAVGQRFPDQKDTVVSLLQAELLTAAESDRDGLIRALGRLGAESVLPQLRVLRDKKNDAEAALLVWKQDQRTDEFLRVAVLLLDRTSLPDKLNACRSLREFSREAALPESVAIRLRVLSSLAVPHASVPTEYSRLHEQIVQTARAAAGI